MEGIVMKTIFKKTLFLDKGTQDVEFPKGAEILTAQMQNGQACIWAIVDPKAALKPIPITLA